MVAPRIEVQGAKELRRAIRKAEAQDLKAELKKAHREGGDMAADEARRIVPRRSGDLGGSIRASGLQTKGVVRSGRAKVPYAGVIHFGWPRRNITPQPFLYEAADRRVLEVVNAYEDAVEAIARRLATAGGTP